tara:strand:+ start:238 stop:507 length:270 start_codon:yes stop_codon:yes gene_type:complete
MPSIAHDRPYYRFFLKHRERTQGDNPSPHTMVDTDEARRIQRRVNTLLRDRDAIIRMLDQADYERLSRDVGRQSVAIERLEALLSGENV